MGVAAPAAGTIWGSIALGAGIGSAYALGANNQLQMAVLHLLICYIHSKHGRLV